MTGLAYSIIKTHKKIYGTLIFRVLFQPKGSADEVKEELEDLAQRETREE